jgi:hypothetical protein
MENLVTMLAMRQLELCLFLASHSSQNNNEAWAVVLQRLKTFFSLEEKQIEKTTLNRNSSWASEAVAEAAP